MQIRLQSRLAQNAGKPTWPSPVWSTTWWTTRVKSHTNVTSATSHFPSENLWKNMSRVIQVRIVTRVRVHSHWPALTTTPIPIRLNDAVWQFECDRVLWSNHTGCPRDLDMDECVVWFLCRTFHTAREQGQELTAYCPHCRGSGTGTGHSDSGNIMRDYTISVIHGVG